MARWPARIRPGGPRRLRSVALGTVQALLFALLVVPFTEATPVVWTL